ncbi:MAG: hypothetical protein HYV28_00625 [Ignavibacteriales bacterium]|nr:hypothetical protein [Ignavibacteriales bacterium]
MPEEFIHKNYAQAVITTTGKKIRYKLLPEHNCIIESMLYEFLHSFNIAVAYAGKTDATTLEFIKTTEYAFGLKISNLVDSRISNALQLPLWSQYSLPVIEYFPVSDPKVRLTANHIISAELVESEELKSLNRLASKINALVKAYFERRDYILASFICQFGKIEDKIYLSGNFSAPSMQLIRKDQIQHLAAEGLTFQNGKQLKTYVENIIDTLRN